MWSRRGEPRFRLCSCTRYVFGIRPLTCGAKKTKTVCRRWLTVMLRYRRKYRQNLMHRLPPKLPSRNEKPSTAENLPSCCVTAVKIPSKFDLPSTAKTVTVKNGKPSTPKCYRHFGLPSRPSPSKISLPNTSLEFSRVNCPFG